MKKRAVEVTENYIRVRVRDMGDFKDETLRLKILSEEKGIKALMGKLKPKKAEEGEDSDSMHIQSYLFNKEKWTEDEAVAWVKDHGETPRAAQMKKRQAIIEAGELSFSIRAVNKELRRIRGYASTSTIDSFNTIFDPDGWPDAIEEYMRNPVVDYMHDITSPVGKVVEWAVDEVGLFVEVEVGRGTELMERVWTEIDQGITKGFSIWFEPKEYQELDGGVILFIRWLLRNISIVSVPSNPLTIFEVKRMANNKQKTQEDLNMDLDLKNLVTKEDYLREVGQLAKDIAEVKGKVSSTKELAPEDKVRFDRIETGFKKLEEGYDGINKNEQFQRLLKFQGESDLDLVLGQRMGAADYNDLIGLSIHKPNNQKEADVRRMQELHDQLHILGSILSARHRGGYPIVLGKQKVEWKGIRSLPQYSEWEFLTKKYTRFLATSGTGLGAEWVPTDVAATMHDQVRATGELPGMMSNQLNAPSNPWIYPVAGVDPYGKRLDQQTAVPTTFPSTESAAATAKTTFTHRMLWIRMFFSGEELEDSIIAILPQLQALIPKVAARTLERSMINGDTVAVASHQDFDVQSAGADDFRGLVWPGFRKSCFVPTTDRAFAMGGALSTANLRSIRKLLGKFGKNPSELVWVWPLGTYFLALNLAEVLTFDKFGQFATVANGVLERFDGIKIVASEESPENLHTTGVNTNGGANNTGMPLIFHNPSWALSFRRRLQIEQVRWASHDSFELAAFMRVDMESFFPAVAGSGVLPVASGINCPV